MIQTCDSKQYFHDPNSSILFSLHILHNCSSRTRFVKIIAGRFLVGTRSSMKSALSMSLQGVILNYIVFCPRLLNSVFQNTYCTHTVTLNKDLLKFYLKFHKHLPTATYQDFKCPNWEPKVNTFQSF